jgi:hypothetical protein
LIRLKVLAMNLSSLRMAAAVTALFVAALPAAQAVTLDSVQAHGNTVGTDFFAPELIAADIGFNADTAVTLNMKVDGNEAQHVVGFNAVLDQLQPGKAFSKIQLTLSGGATFLLVGSTTTLNNLDLPFASTTAPDAASIWVPVPETGVYVGNPFGGQEMDWYISLDGLAAGQSFSLTVSAVPETSTLALTLAGLGLVGLWGLRARRQA